MSTFVCFGLGYSAEHFVAEFGESFDAHRRHHAQRRARRGAECASAGRLKALVFDGKAASPELRQAIGDADAALVSIPQDESGDPVLRSLRRRLLHARSICARSSICRRSASMATAAAPGSTRRRRRSRNRRAAASGSPPNTPGKISAQRPRRRRRYSCGSPAFTGRAATRSTQIARGEARRIVKPGQVFNRIHVADIAQAIDAAFARAADGIFNVADDEPSPPGDPLVFAAQLLGRDPPPEIPFAEAAPSMSPMALSFWQECRRVRNDKLKRELGVDAALSDLSRGVAGVIRGSIRRLACPGRSAARSDALQNRDLRRRRA